MSVGALRLAAATGLALLWASSAPAVTLANGGRAQAPILLAADASRAERTAAEELAAYLLKATGARFPVREEPAVLPRGPVILVGPTRLAARIGLTPGRLRPEEWALRADGDRLVLAGGRPRGTLYAVYHFLEDELGIRWWTPFEETVPRRGTLRIGELDRRGRPAFAYRDLGGLDGRAEFRARNRLNGDASGISDRFGGREAFGSPGFVHSFYSWFPPDAFFDAHPEFYSERAGLRAAGRSQLCLSNPELPRLLAGKIAAIAGANERAASTSGAAVPVLYDVSQNDWGGKCECAACAARAAREGSDAGALMAFLNDVASRLRPEHPEVRLVTLAYTYTFAPPRETRPDERVVVRLTGYGKRDFTRAAEDPANATFRDAVTAWSRIAPHLWIWDYAVTFLGNGRTFPIPSQRHYASDLRFYRDLGVEGVFAQHDFPIAGDLHDLKVWLYAKLLEDPDRDETALVREFTDGYYGAAGRWIRRYLRQVETAADSRPSRIGAESDAEAFRYVDDGFLAKAEDLFDRATSAVGGDEALARRVRHARLSLDYAALTSGPTALPKYRETAERYRRTWLEQIDLRADPGERESMRAEIEAEVREFLSRPRRAP